jgi:dihydroorotate dehydrogenase (fumarate)
MDLSTRYLGFHLKSPFVPGASPLVDEIDTVRRLEDAGAAAIVMHSLFEEQITTEQMATFKATETHADSFAEARSFLPSPDQFHLGPEEYLEHLRKVKAAVSVPVIASLNGTTLGGWLEYALLMEKAGADALELNVYSLATDPESSGKALEDRTLEMVRVVKEKLKIPVAVKLSPFYSSLAHFASELDAAGADGLVVFNRFYQPDVDIESLDVSRSLHLSHSNELPLRLRWLAILSPRVKASLAVTGGVHTAVDAIKAIMTGAHVVQTVSALLQRGPQYLKSLVDETKAWLEQHEYESIEQMRGSMNLASCPDAGAFERANYMLMLQSWRG